MPARTPSPEQRAQQQLEKIQADLMETLSAIDVHPEQSEEILAKHRDRVAGIIRQGRSQPRPVRRVRRDLPLFINLSWSLLMITVVILVSWLTGWEAWPVVLPLAFWVVFQAFVWTVGVPYLLLVVSLCFAAFL